MGKYLSFLIFVVALAIQAKADKLERVEEEGKILEHIFGAHQNNLKLVRPPGEHTNVTVNMYVRNILSICDKYHMWKVQLTFRQEWTDTRLSYTPTDPEFKYILMGEETSIWMPDLFFADEVKSEDHQQLRPNFLLRVHPDGHVMHSKRVTIEMFCPKGDMRSKEFTCPMRIASYAHTIEELDVHWKVDEAVQVNKNMGMLDNFVLHEVTTTTCNSVTKMGTFGCILAEFKMGRDSSCKA